MRIVPMFEAHLPEFSGFASPGWAALLSGILGGAVLTVFAVWTVHILAFSNRWTEVTEVQRITILGRSLILLLVGIIAVLLSQGFAINRRKIEITKDGIRMEGGGGPAAAAIDKASKAADALPSTPGDE